MNLLFHQQSIVLVKNGSDLAIPQIHQISGINFTKSIIQNEEINLLGFIEDPDTLIGNDELELVSLRNALNLFPLSHIQKIVHAHQLVHYQLTNRYCSSCGGLTQIFKHKYLSCSSCGLEVYPRISPAMIVAITKGDELLMSRGHHFPPGIWGLIAGFCEIGESLEQTVERETFEEVGLKIKNIRYWGSQYWPFPNSLMVAFTAEYDSGELKVDNTELSDAGFFKYDQLPGRPSTSLSIASRLIDDFITKHASIAK